MWTREEYEAGIPALKVLLVRENGVAKHYAIFPADGFLVRVPVLDMEHTTDNGATELTEYVSHGGCVERLSYDWSKNPKGYAAVHQTEVEKC